MVIVYFVNKKIFIVIMKKFQKKLKGGVGPFAQGYINALSAYINPSIILAAFPTIGMLQYIYREIAHNMMGEQDINAHQLRMPRTMRELAFFINDHLLNLPVAIGEQLLREAHAQISFARNDDPSNSRYPNHTDTYPLLAHNSSNSNHSTLSSNSDNSFRNATRHLRDNSRHSSHSSHSNDSNDIENDRQNNFGISSEAFEEGDIELGQRNSTNNPIHQATTPRSPYLSGMGRRVNKRGLIVSQVMKKYGMSLGQASRFVKDYNLY